MKTRAFILLFFLFVAGCTVQFELPPQRVITNLPDGGKVDVLPDSITAMYSGRPRFYWEQIIKSDSTYSFAVTNGKKDGHWVRGDSMRWHTSGPFVTVMGDTLKTIVDSTRLTQDSILVYYQNGTIVRRDTISGTGGGGGGGADNWGSQVVVSDGTLTGDGTSGNALKVDTSIIATQSDIPVTVYTGDGTLPAANRTITLNSDFDFSIVDNTFGSGFYIDKNNLIIAVYDPSETAEFQLDISEAASASDAYFRGANNAKIGVHNTNGAYISTGSLSLLSGATNTTAEIKTGSHDFVITDNSTDGDKGLEYAADYSASYKDRTLPDVAWVRGEISDSAQVIDTFSLSGTTLNLSLESDGEAAKTVDLSSLTTNETITLSGDVTGSGTTAITTTIAAGAVGADELESTAVTPGSYTHASITVDADGRVTEASSGTDLNGIFSPANSGGTVTSGMLVNLEDSLVFRDSRGIDSPNFILNLERAGVFPSGDHYFIRMETDYNSVQLPGLESLSRLLEYRDSGKRSFSWYDIDGDAYLSKWDKATGSSVIAGFQFDENGSITIGSDSTLMLNVSGVYLSDQSLTTSDQDTVLVVGPGYHGNFKRIYKKAISDLTVGDDDWGSQVVVSDSTLSGNGTASSPLSVVGGGADGNGIYDGSGIVPTTTDAEVTDNFAFTDGANDIVIIERSTGHVGIGKGSSAATDFSLNVNEAFTGAKSSAFGGLQISPVWSGGATSSGGMLGIFSAPVISGTDQVAYFYGSSYNPNYTSSAGLASLQGVRARPTHGGAGTLVEMSALYGQIRETGAGDVVIGYGLNVDVNSGTFENVYGVNVNDQTATTSVFGVRTGISSGSGKYNVYASGTADNYFRGNIGIGDGNTSPAAELDIAGDMILDGIFYDKDGDAGSAGDVLTSTGSATNWVSPQYAQSYNTGGENNSITAGTPEQVISTTLGTTDTIAATSEFTVQSDADIQYTGSNDAVIKITAEAAIDPTSSVYALYYIAINGVIQNSSRFRVYSPGTSVQPMSVNITFIDTDADNGDVYSLYVDSTSGTIGYTVYDFRLTAEKIK